MHFMKAFNKVFAHQPVIRSWICSHREELIEILKDLTKMPTFRTEPLPGAPYGKACAEGLDAVESLYRKYGFEPQADREDGYLLVQTGTGERTIGLFSHGDVVAPGEGWLYTNPFTPIQKNGFLIGRGVLDDKSAIVISLACARMLLELTLPFAARLVCYTGFNEESGMQDIRAYCKKNTPPDFALVCDTAFPLYRGNKGMMHLHVTAETSFSDILDFSGGEALNITLGKATMQLKNSERLYEWLKKRETPELTVEKKANSIFLQAVGISRHGALPEGSRNAGGMIAAFLKDCPELPENDLKLLCFMAELLQEYEGKTLKIQSSSPVFGPLTCINGRIRTENGRPALDLDIRYGDSITADAIADRCTAVFHKEGWQVRVDRIEKTHLTPEDNPYIRTCMGMYQAYTGNFDAKIQINAGGTYAMHLPCSAEIGTMLWKPAPFSLMPGHGGAHQPDECISIDGMMEALELTMLMVLGCGQPDTD